MSSDLQFEKAEYSDSAAATACQGCQGPLKDSYFTVAEQILCRGCAEKLRVQLSEQGSRVGRMGRAIGAGVVAAGLGTLLYYGVLALTGYEFGLIAIVVGFAVGAAVRWGSYGRGGWAYQGLAMVLTYLSIVSAYVPQIIGEIREMKVEEAASAPATAGSAASGSAVVVSDTNAAVTTDDTAPGAGGVVVAIVVLFAIACAAPFLAGAQNIIGLIIIGIGLYEAWKLNRHVSVEITGPHPVSAAPPAAA